MHPLIQHIEKVTARQVTEPEKILSFFDTRTFKKKELLQEEDRPCESNFFVLKGCLRLYFTDDQGSEQTLQLAPENWWMTDLDAFRTRKQSAYSIQALEAAEVLAINAANYELLLEQVPLMEKYFRLVYERAYSANLLRVSMISRMPKPDFYRLFESKYPEFIQRVPQKILASFLGFSPEYLSELRKKEAERRHS